MPGPSKRNKPELAGLPVAEEEKEKPTPDAVEKYGNFTYFIPTSSIDWMPH